MRGPSALRATFVLNGVVGFVHQLPHCFYQCYCYAAVVVPAVPCQLNLTGPEGYIEAPPHTNSAFYFTTDCNYIVTVYTGYGVEVQVRKSSTSTQDMR